MDKKEPDTGAETQRSGIRIVSNILDFEHARSVRANVAASGDPRVPTVIDGVPLSPVAREMIGYWYHVAAGRPMPHADDIRPSDIAQLLPYVRYGRWESENSLVYRVWGSAITEVVGDMSGINIFELTRPERRREAIRTMKLLHEVPCGVVFRRHIPMRDGSLCLSEGVSLPVEGEDGHDRVLGISMLLEQRDAWRLEMQPTDWLPAPTKSFLDLGFGVPELPLASGATE